MFVTRWLENDVFCSEVRSLNWNRRLWHETEARSTNCDTECPKMLGDYAKLCVVCERIPPANRQKCTQLQPKTGAHRQEHTDMSTQKPAARCYCGRQSIDIPTAMSHVSPCACQQDWAAGHCLVSDLCEIQLSVWHSETVLFVSLHQKPQYCRVQHTAFTKASYALGTAHSSQFGGTRANLVPLTPVRKVRPSVTADSVMCWMTTANFLRPKNTCGNYRYKYSGWNAGWGCLRIGFWGEYLGVGGTRWQGNGGHDIMRSLMICNVHQQLFGWSNREEWDGRGM